MVYRALIRVLIALTVAVIAATGCNNPNAIPKHSPDEERAINSINAMTPQQRIDMIQKGPMPEAAKAQMIKKIKAENHLD